MQGRKADARNVELLLHKNKDIQFLASAGVQHSQPFPAFTYCASLLNQKTDSKT
jgi:hypothetical protein